MIQLWTDDGAHLAQEVEEVSVEDLVSEGAIEAFDVGILRGPDHLAIIVYSHT